MGATIGSCWQECEGISNNATILISESFAISLPNKTIYIYGKGLLVPWVVAVTSWNKSG